MPSNSRAEVTTTSTDTPQPPTAAAPVTPTPIYTYTPYHHPSSRQDTTAVVGRPAPTGLLETVLPALQSGSYVILIVLGFVLWSSRTLARDFMVKHINLVESLKDNLDTQLDTAKVQMDVLHRLTENNAILANTIQASATCPVVFPGSYPAQLAPAPTTSDSVNPAST